MNEAEIRRALEAVFSRITFRPDGVIRAERVMFNPVGKTAANTAEKVTEKIPAAVVLGCGECREGRRYCFWVDFRLVVRKKILRGG